MNKLRVAVLEDEQLKFIVELIRETNLFDVVAYADNSTDFIHEVNNKKPDILFLDIDLRGDSLSGLDVANKLKLPVVFLTGKILDYVKDIEDIDATLTTVPIAHITKPITLEKLQKRLPKFIDEVRALSNTATVQLSFLNGGLQKIKVDSIVYITSEGESSNNKVIYFSNRTPEILINFSFSNMSNLGFDESMFLNIHQSYRVNKSYVDKYLSTYIEVYRIGKSGNKEKVELKISENYQPVMRKIFK